MYNCHCCYQCQSIYVNPIYLYEQLSQKWRVPECFEVNDCDCHLLKGPHWVPWGRLRNCYPSKIIGICNFCNWQILQKRNYELQIAALDNHYLFCIFIEVTVFWNFVSKFCSIFSPTFLPLLPPLCVLCDWGSREKRKGTQSGGRGGGPPLIGGEAPELIQI